MRIEDYYYLMFRRSVIFLDEWFSYMLLLYLYYHRGERNGIIVGIIVGLVFLFNMTGYYYLGLLEERFRVYEESQCYLF